VPSQGRRETWKETARRAAEYNVQLGVRHLKKLGYPVNYDWYRKEAQELFQSMFELKQALSGRTLWVGGDVVAEKYPMANFNCSFTNVKTWDDLAEVFYLLMLGTGVGFKATKKMAAGLDPIRTDTTLLHSDYNPVAPHERLEATKLELLDNGYAKIYVGDSKEGWVAALRTYFHLLTKPEHASIHTIKISYNSVRPKGERLKVFGGTASGPEPLREMFAGIDKVLKNQIDPTLDPLEMALDADGYTTDAYHRVRPVHILDIGNLIGNNVVVGKKTLCPR
jgi:ribonucleoside-diphosphate reductase alpha chain/ribonucleoside-triphosphate reductase